MADGKRKRRAKGSTKQAAQADGDGNGVRWVNPSPNTQDVEWLEDNLVQALEDVLAVFEGLHGRQRFTCKHDSRTDRWVAVLFDNSDSEGEPTPALSVRGASALDAIILLGYCVVRKYPDGWQAFGVAAQGRFG